MRIEAGVIYALDTLGDEGHVFAPRGELCERAAQLLGVDAASAGEALQRLINESALINEDDRIFPPLLHRAELELASHLKRLVAAERGKPPSLGPEAQHLSAGQKRALELAQSRGVGVITGGPGTGKTTIVRALVAAWLRAKRRVLLAAPTGRAAKRLSEATGRPAQTVHRLLEWGRPQGGRSPFGRDAQHPLEADLLVVDEASMLDLLLARALAGAVPSGCTLILVGDVDQLPSVGAGQVLADAIASGALPVARLTEVFRQAEGSGITENAYRILRGELPEAGREKEKSDFHLVAADEPERARELVVKLCSERIPRAFGFDPIRDVQVLTPMHRGAAGTEELNRALQAALNPSGEAAGPFRVGDKVMQLRNDYDRDVFNGDVGRVHSIDDLDGEPLVRVDLDGRVVEYSGDALDQLELAYAVSVHKSQGSEYPAVVLLLLPQHFVMLRRNLFYTAVTRGKRLVVVVGAPRAIKRAVSEGGGMERHTSLADRLR
jgi:exodeoxyribonuclease V alpha subunit